MSERYEGPVMLSVTNILRPPPARIGQISEKFVLPRTIELRVFLASIGGFFAGMVLWFAPVGLFFDYSITSLLTMVALGGFVGYVFVTWSPLKGESLATWLGLSAAATRPGRVVYQGKKVHAFLGVAPIGFLAAGPVHIRPGAIDVPAGSVDERGVPYTKDEIVRLLGDAAARQAAFPAR